MELVPRGQARREEGPNENGHYVCRRCLAVIHGKVRTSDLLSGNTLMNITLSEAVTAIEQTVIHPEKGLQPEVFRLITKLTPMINVDLLIKNETGETLLTWREETLCEPGWHIPGGIIRFEEPIEHRIHAVAETELRSDVDFSPAPLSVTEFILPDQEYRNHFISLLYRCRLLKPLPRFLHCSDLKHPQNGEYAWFSSPPENLLKVHKKYRSFF